MPNRDGRTEDIVRLRGGQAIAETVPHAKKQQVQNQRSLHAKSPGGVRHHQGLVNNTINQHSRETTGNTIRCFVADARVVTKIGFPSITHTSRRDNLAEPASIVLVRPPGVRISWSCAEGRAMS